MDVKIPFALSLIILTNSQQALASDDSRNNSYSIDPSDTAQTLDQIFDSDTGHGVIVLSRQEMLDTQGAWWFAPALVGGTFSSAAYIWSTPRWTWRGVGRAFGSGATAAIWGVTPIHWIARAGLGAFGAASWYKF